MLQSIWHWLVRDWQWPHAALFVGLFILALMPVMSVTAGPTATLIALQLPI